MASVPSPIDAVQTPEWKALKEHHDRLEEEGISLKDWFAADPDRVNKLSFEAGDLHFDLSKNLITDETVKLLADLGRAVRVEERRDEMLSGVHINTTEDRAVLHTALRRPASEKGTLIVDGQDVVADVHEVLDRMYAFAEKVRSGAWKGVSGKRIEHVVSVGIGGSDLGPVMVYEALKPYADAGIDCRYISSSVLTPRTPSASGAGWAAVIRSTPPWAFRSSSRSVPSASSSSSRASMPSMSTSAPRRSRRTSSRSWAS